MHQGLVNPCDYGIDDDEDEHEDGEEDEEKDAIADHVVIIEGEAVIFAMKLKRRRPKPDCHSPRRAAQDLHQPRQRAQHVYLELWRGLLES